MLGAALCAASCTPGGGTGLHSINEDKRLGESASAKLIAVSGGLYRDRDLEAYLDEVLARLTPNVSLPSGLDTLTISILDTGAPNAYATGGGRIFVTRGMLAMVNDEAELAGIIAHEIAHIAERHVAESRAEADELIRSVERETYDDLRYTGGARSRRLRILQTAYEARAGELTEFSRSQELEADRVGQDLLAKAGYPGSGMIRVLAQNDSYKTNLVKRLGLSEQELDEMVDSSGYPKTDERLAELMRGQDSARNTSRDQDRLMVEIDGLQYGEDFKFGYVRDGAFWKPGSQISFDVPETVLPVQFGTMALVTRGGVILFHSDSDKTRQWTGSRRR